MDLVSTLLAMAGIVVSVVVVLFILKVTDTWDFFAVVDAWRTSILVEQERRAIAKAVMRFRSGTVFELCMAGLDMCPPLGPFMKIALERSWTEENIYRLANIRVKSKAKQPGKTQEQIDKEYMEQLDGFYKDILREQYEDRLTHLRGVYQAGVRQSSYGYDQDGDIRQHLCDLDDNEVHMLKIIQDAEAAYEALGKPSLASCATDPLPSELLACVLPDWGEDMVEMSLWELCVEGYLERDKWDVRLPSQDLSHLRSLLSPFGHHAIRTLSSRV